MDGSVTDREPTGCGRFEDALLDAGAGAPGAPEADLLDRHLEGCARCRAARRDLGRVAALLAGGPAPPAALEERLVARVRGDLAPAPSVLASALLGVGAAAVAVAVSVTQRGLFRVTGPAPRPPSTRAWIQGFLEGWSRCTRWASSCTIRSSSQER